MKGNFGLLKQPCIYCGLRPSTASKTSELKSTAGGAEVDGAVDEAATGPRRSSVNGVGMNWNSARQPSGYGSYVTLTVVLTVVSVRSSVRSLALDTISHPIISLIHNVRLVPYLRSLF